MAAPTPDEGGPSPPGAGCPCPCPRRSPRPKHKRRLTAAFVRAELNALVFTCVRRSLDGRPSSAGPMEAASLLPEMC